MKQTIYQYTHLVSDIELLQFTSFYVWRTSRGACRAGRVCHVAHVVRHRRFWETVALESTTRCSYHYLPLPSSSSSCRSSLSPCFSVYRLLVPPSVHLAISLFIYHLSLCSSDPLSSLYRELFPLTGIPNANPQNVSSSVGPLLDEPSYIANASTSSSGIASPLLHIPLIYVVDQLRSVKPPSIHLRSGGPSFTMLKRWNSSKNGSMSISELQRSCVAG